MFGRKETNILVVKTDSLAGFVAAEPVFAAIREAHPHSKISLLTIPPLQRIARASPYFDQVAGVQDMRNPEARKEFIKQLKNAKFEKIYDLAADDTAKKLQSAMGPFGPKWFGASPAPRSRRTEGFGSQRLPVMDKVIAEAGLSAEPRLPDLRWAMTARKDSANMKPAWYGITGAFGLLMPGPAEDQRWSVPGYAGLASIMATEGFMPVLVGPKELHDFGDAIADISPQLVDLTGKTDHLQLAALAHESSFFVSDGAEEIDLAVSVGCEGVLITKPGTPAPDGRHVVTLTSGSGLASVDHAFVWRTLWNMGLIDKRDGAPKTASA